MIEASALAMAVFSGLPSLPTVRVLAGGKLLPSLLSSSSKKPARLVISGALLCRSGDSLCRCGAELACRSANMSLGSGPCLWPSSGAAPYAEGFVRFHSEKLIMISGMPVTTNNIQRQTSFDASKSHGVVYRTSSIKSKEDVDELAVTAVATAGAKIQMLERKYELPGREPDRSTIEPKVTV